MYSRFRVFIWRRRFLIILMALLSFVGIWAWTFYYTTNNAIGSTLIFGNEDGSNKIQTVQELDAKYDAALNGQQQPDGVRFVQPPQRDDSRRLRERFQSFSSLFSNKDAEKVLQNVKDEKSGRDENRHANDDDKRMAAERQSNYEKELHRMGVPIVTGVGPGGRSPPSQRLVHLDLKGAPPKISYLKRLLPIMKSLGATGLLIEYEDMFPYTSPIDQISATNAYTEAEVRDLLQAAAATGLTVMPLVQTLGHLEFALKSKQFEHLREVPDSPESLCPSRDESIDLIKTMIRQMIELHLPQPKATSNQQNDSTELTMPKFTHLHIGCDEVYHMGVCSKCVQRIKDEIFLTHVRTIALYIRENWPQLKVVIWDDMLRHMNLTNLQQSHIGELVEPMVWVYDTNIYKHVSTAVWDKFSSVFSTVWTATAFKGAHGVSLMVPPARPHLENHLKWLAVINAQSVRFKNGIQGVALTGWQRYDHFAVLCELLPVAIPILALCLSATSKGYFESDTHENHILSALTCPEPMPPNLVSTPWLALNTDSDLKSFTRCMFPGSQVMRFVFRVIDNMEDARLYLDDPQHRRGWLTEYNIRHNFSAPMRIADNLPDVVKLEQSLNMLIMDADDIMIEVFDKWTIDEFMEQTVMPLLERLRRLIRSADTLAAIRTWPRRPIPYALDENQQTKEKN